MVTMDPPPDSSSPRAKMDSSLENHAPPLQSQTSPKLRLMCSYGGHIVPRPHDKSLCYVGGDTRIVVMDRHAVSLTSLIARLSSTLMNGRPFALKYQLPNEDLDSLISVATDEDLENMLEEYDRTAATALRASAMVSSRLRLFLFPLKADSPQSLLDNGVGKGGEDWFFSVLNGTHHLNRGFSDSPASSVNCLLGLDDPQVNSVGDGNNRDAEGLSGNSGGGATKKQDVHSVPDSPMMETTSSFGSTSSSPSMANLPPIKVHVPEDQKATGIEEQFAQVSLIGGGGAVKSDEGLLVISSPPPMPVSIVPVDLRERVCSDDERSDHGGVGTRRPLPAPPHTHPQPPFQPQRLPSSHDLASPDSVSSDTSFANVMKMKPMLLQESVVQIPPMATPRIPTNVVEGKPNLPELASSQQRHDSGFMLQTSYDQPPPPPPQFIHPSSHYIHHPGGVSISAYYPVGVYPPQQQQHHQHQQLPVYYVSARPQSYNLPSIGDAGTPRMQMPPSAAMVAPQPAYIPMRSSAANNPEAAKLLQVPSNALQQQYVAYSQVAPPSATARNYGYELMDSSRGQVYYAPSFPGQYQTMSESSPSPQISSDSTKQQQARASQPM